MTSTRKRKKPEDSVLGIHKRNGIWQDGLARVMGPELLERWGIAEDAEASRVREIVLLRLNRVLVQFASPEMSVIVWTAYNLGAASPGEESGVVRRLERLVDQGGVECSVRTCTRRFNDIFLPDVVKSLSAGQSPITDEDLGRASRWLAANIRPDVPEPVADGLSAAIRGLRTPMDPVLKMFLDGPVHGPADGDGVPLAAKLGARGEWLCVFTGEELLATYRESTGASWARTGRWTGRDVVRTAAGRIFPTGILIDPSPSIGAGAEATLPLPPDEIARLAREC
nr:MULTISPECIES: SseB family protein [unclassified Amycolatopsis]